jgi:hypothetical protein
MTPVRIEGVAMCRSIKTLRPPYTEDATSADSRAAALQYVRKVAGMRSPSRANQEAFDAAVAQIAAVTDELLASLVLPARAIAG